MRCHPDAHGDSGHENDQSDDLEDAVDEPEAAEGQDADHDAAGWEEEDECFCCTDCMRLDFKLQVSWLWSTEAAIFAALSIWVAAAAAAIVVSAVVATWRAAELCCCEGCCVVRQFWLRLID